MRPSGAATKAATTKPCKKNRLRRNACTLDPRKRTRVQRTAFIKRPAKWVHHASNQRCIGRDLEHAVRAANRGARLNVGPGVEQNHADFMTAYIDGAGKRAFNV